MEIKVLKCSILSKSGKHINLRDLEEVKMRHYKTKYRNNSCRCVCFNTKWVGASFL